MLAQPVPALALIAANLCAALWAFAATPGTLIYALSCALGWTLAALAEADLLTYRLPDFLTLPLIVCGLAVSQVMPEPDIVAHAAGALGGFAMFAILAAVYERMKGHEGLGLGDAKLVAAAGAWLGWQALPSVVLIGALGGILWVGVRSLFRGRELVRERIAFGAPLCAAFWLVWLYGPLIPAA